MNDSEPVIFNSNDISQLDGVWIYSYNATNLPTRDINIFKLARRSLSIVTSADYSQKEIPVLMRVCGGSRFDTEEIITNIKGLLQPQNGTLEIAQSNRQVQYTATMNEFNIEWETYVAWVEVVFLISSPVAEAVNAETLTTFSTSLSSDGASFEVEGSYIAEPLITVTINAVTGGTGSFSIFNASTNQGITISGTFANGDIIEIDGENYTVQVNGAAKDFEGLFPTFPPGTQRLGYTDTFSTRTVTVTAEYRVKIV